MTRRATSHRGDHTSATIAAMAGVFGKRQRGKDLTSLDPYSATRRTLQARVTYEQFDKAHRAAEALGVSISGLVAELVDRLELDEHGNPGWTSRYASPAEPDEPLDLSA